MNFRTVIYSILLSLFFIACNQKSDKVNDTSTLDSNIDAETEQMKSELRLLAEDRSNINVWHLNKERAIQYDKTWPALQDPGQRITLMFKSSMEWLNAGDYEKSIQLLNSIFEFIRVNNIQIDPNAMKQARELLGISYLRKAEVENCIRHHNAYSCVFPIQADGQHVERDGALNALSVFEGLLLSLIHI